MTALLRLPHFGHNCRLSVANAGPSSGPFSDHAVKVKSIEHIPIVSPGGICTAELKGSNMRKTFYYIAGGALASISIPAMAQDVSAQEPATAETVAAPAAELTAEQQVSYDGWPAEQQSQFDAWPEEVKAYYWSLTPDRQELFWRISDENKVTITVLSAEQQAQAWMQIETQAAAQAQAPAAAPEAAPAEEPTPVEEVAAEPEEDAADPM